MKWLIMASMDYSFLSIVTTDYRVPMLITQGEWNELYHEVRLYNDEHGLKLAPYDYIKQIYHEIGRAHV